jgi:sulfopyruvate decarboxylase alpha subunit
MATISREASQRAIASGRPVADTLTEGDWSRALLALFLEHDVRLFAYVPDAGNARLVHLIERQPDARAVLLTTEEEGVALCAGADLAGRRAVLLMQSSGVGNCGNFFSLTRGARFPILMMISMRGDFGETNPWQYPMGQATLPYLAAMEILPFVVSEARDLEGAARAAMAAAFKGGNSAALILSQRFLGAKAM